VENQSKYLFANRCSAPYPPSPNKTDQHAVVTFTFPSALVTLLGIICHVGVEPTYAAPRDTMRRHSAQHQLSQLAGLCSLLFSPATICIGLVDLRFHICEISDQFSQPVKFLNTGVKLAVILCEVIGALLDFHNIDRPDVLHFRTCVTVLGKRSRLRQIGVNSPT